MEKINKRLLDIIIWGATGFTGKKCVEYFIKNSPSFLKWGIAGRDQNKLMKIKNDILNINNKNEIEIFIGNVNDQNSIDNIVSKTNVILSTVGPYSYFGTPIVDACVRLGTDYCDITGESLWVKELINKYHNEAQKKGVMIVPFCGFDSIPSDLGSLMVENYISSKLNRKCLFIKGYFLNLKGGISGGTSSTVISTFEKNKNSNSYHMFSSHLLNSKKKTIVDNREKDEWFIKYDKQLKYWTVPFFMSVVNTRVVRRSNELLEKNYGYNEVIATKYFFIAFFIYLLTSISFTLLSIRFTRNIIKKFLPKPGEGPNEKKIEQGSFKVKFIGEPEIINKNEIPKKIIGTVIGNSDPGYGETVKMVCESAFCLALQKDQLPGKQGGILTPASAMGLVLIERLKKQGMIWKIEEDNFS